MVGLPAIAPLAYFAKVMLDGIGQQTDVELSWGSHETRQENPHALYMVKAQMLSFELSLDPILESKIKTKNGVRTGCVSPQKLYLTSGSN